VDDDLRLNLIEALKNRRWTNLDAESAAADAAAVYPDGEGPWQVWHSQLADDPDCYWVARLEHGFSAYKSLLEGRARDVADVLNELEGRGSDATGAH
jgi:hypothetical protein